MFKYWTNEEKNSGLSVTFWSLSCTPYWNVSPAPKITVKIK